jgi:bifunctional DNA-binding transcriptional regulator/antitoxin component of YhaV-PrlF toxin-antitoxin module
LATVDCRGRIADRTVVRALGWAPGTRVGIRQVHGVLVIGAAAGGMTRVSSEGHVRLPAAVRRGCGLVAGDRVLLAADPVAGRLVVYPPAALDMLITECDAGLRDGDRA